MSEYQYYEFLAIDKPLTERQMGDLRKLSTRAEITTTSFTNEYHWGDFRGNPRAMMENYFDAFLYYANWGTHWFMLRLPARLVDIKTIKQYGGDDFFSIRTKNKYVLLEFRAEDESGEWEFEDESHRLASLIPLRNELIGGDFRSLYLGWLAALQAGEIGEDEVEPPLPPGMKRLSASLQSMADFLRIDAKLRKVAASPDVGEPPSMPDQKDFIRWIKSLSVAKKDSIVVQLAKGEYPHQQAVLLQEFQASAKKKGASKIVEKNPATRRTAGELLTAAGINFSDQWS